MWQDWVRYVVLTEMLFSVGFTVARLTSVDMWHRDRARFFIALSVLCYSAAGAGIIRQHLGKQLTWYTPTLAAAATLLIVAQWFIGRGLSEL